MVHGILSAVIAIVFVTHAFALGTSFSVLDGFMRLRRRANDSEACCKVSVIDSILEDFPPIEVRYIIKMAARSETLEEYCMTYERRLAKLLEYVAECCFDRSHTLLKNQVEGIEELHVTTCLNKLIFDLLVENSECLGSVLDSSNRCVQADDFNTTGDISPQLICPRLRSVIDCFTEQASEYCSYEAASLLNKIFKRVVKATIRVDCGVCFHVHPDEKTSSEIDRPRLTATIVVLSMIMISLVILRWSYSRRTCS